KHGLKVFYTSTDYVFPGTKGGYSEKDVPNPPNWYGYTKYAGELEILASGCKHCIMRTSFRPADWGFPTAYTNVYTSADYVNVIAKELALCINYNLEGIIHIGTPRKSFYELAKRRNPGIKPEECTDASFPKLRDMDISKWLSEKAKR
ncbi:MAG: sugar nucleotide-binding protein, partial [Candidatus Bilamarchaeaceae archaeon]